VVARHPAGNQDAFEPEFADEVFAGLVQSGTDLHAAVVRVNHDFDAVQVLAVWVMVADVSFTADVLERVVFFVGVKVEDEAARAGHESAVDLHDNLPLGEMAQVAGQLGLFPRPHAGKAILLQGNDGVEIGFLHGSKVNRLLEAGESTSLLCRRFCHRSRLRPHPSREYQVDMFI
jgi:hypothetical protein